MTAGKRSMTTEAFRVRRRIRVPALRRDEDATAVQSVLASIGGVLWVSTDSTTERVTLDYLQTRTDYGSLVDALHAAGFPATRGRWASIRRTWLINLDATARANAGMPQTACCSRPPGRARLPKGR